MKNKYINESIIKNQNYFSISLISQIIEEIELDYNNNISEKKEINEINKKIIFSIFSLLKFQITLLKQLFIFQNKHMYNIIQFQEMKNILDNGKFQIKKILKEILSYSKIILENYNKNNDIINNYINTDSNIQNITKNKKVIKKKYNTKTFNQN